MRQVILALFVAAVLPCDARTADAPRVPTSPQVPVPGTEATSVHTAGTANRMLVPLRDRFSLVHPINEVDSTSSAAWIAPTIEEAPCATPGRHCGGSVVAGSPIKSWLFYRPSTAHALPWLRPHPYVGPVAGQFHCSPAACPQCTGASACAPGTACGRGLGVGAGRGCRNGDCIPPADEVFNGYKFAQPIAPGVMGRTAVPTTTSTSYKQGVAPSGTSESTAPKTGTVLESLKRNFSKP
jgi:hypothetical protein